MKTKFAALAVAFSALICGPELRADEAMRNYGATNVSGVAPAGSSLPTYVAFGHHRRGCCGGSSYGAYYGGYGLNSGLYNAYSTYQPGGALGYSSYYPGTAAAQLGAYGFGGVYGNGYYGAAGPGVGRYIETPNPYGYYQNGQIWGSSGPTYARPTPVWDSPSGVYGYRYNGWGSYGWGGWGGTGPAGWGYQGGFYW
jgi:hypothetical protein